MKALSSHSKRLLLLLAAAIGTSGLAGCGAYYVGGRWHHAGVVVVGEPAPYYAPAPYPAYEYYYDPGIGAYYCYYPRYGWRFSPTLPPPDAVFWNGAPPGYLPPPPVGFVGMVPPPGLSVQFYFDPVRHVYFYYGPDHHWRYYPGHPPGNAHYWHGGSPRMLPHPPHGAPMRRAPERGHDDHPH